MKALPTFGTVEAAVIILGNNLAGTASVSFNGTAATVASSSEITTTVPARARSGSVTVVTPHGQIHSNVGFRVTPQINTFSPSSGAIGTVVTITGVSLKQTKKVTFSGVMASQFTVISDTKIQATVPISAQTGRIAITTTRRSCHKQRHFYGQTVISSSELKKLSRLQSERHFLGEPSMFDSFRA